MKKEETISVVCAVVYQEGKVFIAQRKRNKSNPGEWEFPGGKVEIGETPEKALKREIKEELGVGIRIIEKIAEVESTDRRRGIELIGYSVEFETLPLDSTDHDQLKWVDINELDEFMLSLTDRLLWQQYLEFLDQSGLS